jgi:RND superfamily putative drug exporter
MLATAARFAIARRRLVLVGFIVALAVFGAIGGPVAAKLSANGGFDDPSSQSGRARVALAAMGQGQPQLLVILTPTAGGSVDSAANAAAGAALTRTIAADVVQVGDVKAGRSVLSYWTSGKVASLRSDDGTKALVSVRLADLDDKAVDRAKLLDPLLQRDAKAAGFTVQQAGLAPIFRDVSDRIEKDLIKAESIAIPITTILLILVFGSAIAALLPLAVGLLAVLGAFFSLRLIVLFTSVSVYATNLATSLGLGLGIDYGLFLLTRYREELSKGAARQDAIVTATRTAGRTIVISAVTVAGSLAALMVFPLFFLRSFGYAGIASTFFAALGAVVLVPALLMLLGDRIEKYDLRKPIRRALHLGQPAPIDAPSAFWHRIATLVMRKAGLTGAATVILLLVLGAPFLNVHFGLPDDHVLPANAAPHTASETLRRDFGGAGAETLYVVAPHESVSSSALATYATALSKVPAITEVTTTSGTFAKGSLTSGPTSADARFRQGGTWLDLKPAVVSSSSVGEHLAAAVRSVPSPFKERLVGGDAAQLTDSEGAIGSWLPVALGLIAVFTFIVLFLFTGSIVMPVKAIAMTLLSLTATFGVMVWGFQEGHLSGLLSFQTTGILDTTTPILMFCLVFGLSMDYEVFLLSRIKEEYDKTGDNTDAVAKGLERTGRLITAAALLIAIVFICFTASSITFIKLLGVGASVAVLVDASLVRGVLVPAFMRLLGDWNWWAPAPLRKVHARWGINETSPDPDHEMVDA